MDYRELEDERKKAIRRMDMVVSLCGLAMFIICLVVFITP